MLDTKRLLDQLVGSGVAGGFAGGLAGGALANVLSGKKGRKLAGSALQLGGLALVGNLAYKAWQSYQQDKSQQSTSLPNAALSSLPVGTAFLPAASDVEATQSLSKLLARSMIMAAKADGQVDTRESQAILNQINTLGLPAEDKAFLFEEYAQPLDIEALASDVDTPEHAAEVYAASALMVDPPSPQESFYLNSLATRLKLDSGLVEQIHATIEQNRVTG